MQKMMNERRNKKGFTLAELLIVVAIIAVLVAIAIPIFTTQLEKSRESTDLANLRSAYAECSAEALTVDTATYTTVYKKVNPKQTTSGWEISPIEVAGKNAPDMVKDTPVYVAVKTDGSYDITTTEPTDKAKKLD